MKKSDKKKHLKNLKLITSFLNNDLKSKLEEIYQFIESIEIEEQPLNCFPIPSALEGKMFGYAIFSDGGCRQNPGPGAWGTMVQNAQGEVLFELSDSDDLTTNNKMELTGAIKGLEATADYCLSQGESLDEMEFFLITDSQYVVKGVNEWMKGWKSRGWKKSDKKEPENLDLWIKLDNLKQRLPKLKANWVKGHSGHPQNERCDELANICMDQLSP